MTISLGQVAAICTAVMTIGAVFTAVARWLDNRFEKQIKAVVEQLNTAIERGVSEAKAYASAAVAAHDGNGYAHPTHHMTPVIQALQLQIAQSLTELKGDVKGVQKEVEALRKAHDDAVSRGSCLYQQDFPGKDR